MLLIFLLISGTREVLAQGTITPEPIFKTPTPRPTDFYDCPQPGEMEGFGEETPSVSWMMSCGLCLSTQMATVIPSPMPTLEGTPGTPAPTPTPTATEQVGDQDSGWMTIEFPVFGDGYSGMQTYPDLIVDGSVSGSFATIAYNVDWQQFFLGSCRDKTGNFLIYADAGVPTAGLCSWQSTWRGSGPEGAGIMNAWWTEYWKREGALTICYRPPNGVDDICSVTGVSSISWTGYVVSGGSVYSEPEPTPAQDLSHCKSIESDLVTVTGFDAEGIFTIPVPTLGQANCIVLMPAFTLPVTAINIIPGINIENDIVFPGATLCVRALNFGTLRILGMAIDLDFYAVLIGAMMILRKVLRS